MRLPFAQALTLLLGTTTAKSIAPPDDHRRVVLLARPVRDSMSAVFRRFNAHWDELGDLNTLERMLGTVRPTQLEYLGCLQGTARGDTVYVANWQPAAELKQLQLAVTGSCDTVSKLVGTWHTHPYRADPQNLPIKERSLSKQDLETFRQAVFPVTLVMWDVDSVDAAVKSAHGAIEHPARLITR
jgi:hypothetical protein